MKTVDILGYRVSANGRRSDVTTAWSIIQRGDKGKYMACANPHSLVVAAQDDTFAMALHSADILLPDGAGILVAARLLNVHIPERVAGMEFFRELSYCANKAGGIKYFFLGSTDVVLNTITKRINSDYPNITVCGTYSPPFAEEFTAEQNAAMVAAINASGADVLWVGMTAPKQEKWILNHRHQLDIKFIGAIGAVFDFYAGAKQRAPSWIQNLGLEWLPRLLREPKRLWRRNFVSSPLFLSKVMGQRARQIIEAWR